MIGKVVEGRYLGSNICKLPDKNVLFIEAEDGERIALSKKNAISIDDVTDQYPSYGGKVMMVMWNDFETSIIQFGVSNRLQNDSKAQKANNTSQGNHKKQEKTHSSKLEIAKKPPSRTTSKQKLFILCIILGAIIMVSLVVLFISKFGSEKNEVADTITTPIYSDTTTTSTDEHTDSSTVTKELVVGEWITLKVGGTEIRFRFDGFTPLQNFEPFGTVVMMLSAIENTSNNDYDAYYFFKDTVRITDAEGFSVPLSSNGWNYDSYDCFTDISSGEKKKIVQAYEYNGAVSDLTMTISDDECNYIFVNAKDPEQTIPTTEITPPLREPSEKDKIRDAVESTRRLTEMYFLNDFLDGDKYKSLSVEITYMEKVSETEYKVSGIATKKDAYGTAWKNKFDCIVTTSNGGKSWDAGSFKYKSNSWTQN